MKCAHSKRHLIAEKNHVREVIAINRGNQATFEWLKKENIGIEAELKSLDVAYSMLKEQIQSIIL
jgi:hypothetical protein